MRTKSHVRALSVFADTENKKKEKKKTKKNRNTPINGNLTKTTQIFTTNPDANGWKLRVQQRERQIHGFIQLHTLTNKIQSTTIFF